MFDPNAQQEQINKLSMELAQAAHPVVISAGNNMIFGQGLSKREWFAGMAMMGVAWNPSIVDYGEAMLKAIALADTMIFELNKNNGVKQ